MGKLKGITMFLCLLTIDMTLNGFVTISGIFHKLFTQIFADSSTWYIGLINSLRNATMALLAPLATTLCLRFGHINVIAAGSILSTAGVLISAFTQNIHVLVISFGFITGLGLCFMDAPNLTLVSIVFEKRRNLALTTVLLFNSIASAVYPLLINFLKNYYGLWGTFIILAGILFQSLAFCAIFGACHNPVKNSRNKEKIFDLKIIRTKETLLLTSASFFWGIVFSIPLTIIPHQAILTGFSDNFSDFLVTYTAIGEIVSKAIIPIIVILTKNRLNCAFGFGISLFITAIPIYMITSVKTEILMITAVVIYGALVGVQLTLYFPTVNEVIGVANLTKAIGFIYFGMGIGYIISAPIAGFVFDMTDSYNYATVVAIFSSIFGGGIVIYVSNFFQKLLNWERNYSIPESHEL